MKVRLIAPAQRPPGQKPARKGLFPPLSLAVLAALTPGDWDVEVVDENLEEHQPDASPDLVGLTAITSVAPRAYRLAAAYRALGVPVVMGGMHASAAPREALEHVDAVVVGEAEGIWGEVLDRCREGNLQGIFQSAERPSLCGLPQPRWDVFSTRRYLTHNLVQTSRGCPNACSFCAVSGFFGRTYRTRPVEEVLAEVSQLKNRLVLFVDDNIVGHQAHARRLFRELASLKVKWMAQSSLKIAEDRELLRLAADSGCAGLFIGFESLGTENLRQVGKSMVNRAEQFLEYIQRIHSYGIGIEGAFIFGLDNDDEGVFRRTVDFARRARLALAQFGIVTPFPGTPLHREMEAEGRIVDRDWSHYTISHAVSRPLQMSRKALEEGFAWAYRDFYSYRSMVRRLLPGLRRHPWLFLQLNLSFRYVIERMLQQRSQERKRWGEASLADHAAGTR